MINTDTRQLKKNDLGEFRSGAGKIVCDHCGFIQICAVRPRDLCKQFLPVIPFVDEIGLGDFANTVRVGVAWSKRLQTNQMVALYNSKRQEIFGLARVINLVAGPIDEILARHAHMNHIMLEQPREDAPDLLKKWQLRNYGPRIINEDTRITTIYLQREPVADVAARLREYEALRFIEDRAAGSGQDNGDGSGHALPDRRAEG